MAALGETFRTARESQGLTLADVAERIHIRSGYLAAIEAEDWQTIGPAVYVRGFIRSYARFLGIDAEAAVAQLGGSVPRTGDPTRLGPPRTEPTRLGGPRPVAARSRPSIWAVCGALVALALVVLVAYEYIQYRQGRPNLAARTAPAAQMSPTAAVEATDAARAPGRPEPGVAAPVKNGGRSSGFAVHLKDSSWLRVTIDGKVAMEGLFAKGTERSFAGRSVTVRVGNAGGVDVSVDGKDLGPMGGPGDVAERSFQL